MGTTTAQAQPIDVSFKQLSDGNGLNGGGGTILGINSSDKIGFFGAAGVAQPSGSQQAAVTRGAANGTVAQLQPAVLSPSAVGPNTSAETSVTVGPATAAWQLATTDMVFCANKPTSQAGLGVGNVRVSAANTIGLTLTNFTAATVTPTASQQYSFIAIRGLGQLSATLTPAAVAPNTTIEQQFTITGVRAGELVQVNKPTSQAGLDIVGCRAVSNNVLGITFANVTAATITPTAGESYAVFGMGGLDPVDNFLVYQTVQSPASVANATTAEQGLTVTGLLATDIVAGISKPTAQAGLLVGSGARVSAANTLGITFGNVTAATITPTASQSYAIAVFRHNPVAPLVIYNATLTPVSVAPNTTAEQTFTVTGLVASTAVWVNKPSAQNGLGIAGVRVSALNTLAINYSNSSSATITPASETYVIGNFQVPLTDASGQVVQAASQSGQAQSILANAMRSALSGASLGLIAGA